MAQQVRTLDAFPKDPNLDPTVPGGSLPPVMPALAVGGIASVLLEHMDLCAQTHMQTHTYT